MTGPPIQPVRLQRQAPVSTTKSHRPGKGTWLTVFSQSGSVAVQDNPCPAIPGKFRTQLNLPQLTSAGLLAEILVRQTLTVILAGLVIAAVLR